MTVRGKELSGFHGSALSDNNDHLNDDNPHPLNRSSRSRWSSSWKRYLACIAIITSLCLIQIGISTIYLTTMGNANYSQITDLPSVQSEPQQKDDIKNNDRSSIDYFIHVTAPKPLPTLVHFDPIFLGGYRNQHMRFVAFVNFAVQNSIPQLLLPSLRWGVAQGEHRGRDAPFDYLFDVAYWNERAERVGLPRLVRYDATVLEGRRRRRSGTTDMMDNKKKSTTRACFNISSNLYSGLDEGVLRNPNTNIRRVNILDEIGKLDGYAHCRRLPPSSPIEQQEQEDVGDEFTYLIAHGGSKGAGRLVSS